MAIYYIVAHTHIACTTSYFQSLSNLTPLKRDHPFDVEIIKEAGFMFIKEDFVIPLL